MHRLSVLLLLIVLFPFASCNKGTTSPDGAEPSKESVYFVKYCAEGLRGDYDASYRNEKGEGISLTKIQGSEFERTIGPVGKGFESSFSIRSYLNGVTFTVRVEVKKDDEPFLVKKEGVGYVSYTID